MNVNLKNKIKSFRKKKVPQKFKTCNCHSVKKTILFFFFLVFYYYYFNQGWIPNFSIKLIGRENWSWIWSGMLKFSKQYHQSMKPELMKYINNALKVKVRLWQVFFLITDCDKFLSTCRAFLYLILQLRGRWFSYML